MSFRTPGDAPEIHECRLLLLSEVLRVDQFEGSDNEVRTTNTTISTGE